MGIEARAGAGIAGRWPPGSNKSSTNSAIEIGI
jgi:hypothetical protein